MFNRNNPVFQGIKDAFRKMAIILGLFLITIGSLSYFAKQSEGVNLSKELPSEEKAIVMPTPAETQSIQEVQEVKLIIEEKELPYRVERRLDSSLPVGTDKVIQQGRPGLEKITYQVTIEQGKEQEHKLIARETIRPPQNKIILFGSDPKNHVASRGGTDFAFKRVVTMEATAYTHTGNKTATGTIPARGTIAVDPKVIPLGTKLYVEGYGYGVARDTGGAIKGAIVDVFMDTEKEAYNWGRRKVKVYIIE